MLTGVFATRLINPVFQDGQGNALALGMIDGNFTQVFNQLVGGVVAIVLAGGTWIILKLVDPVIGVRVPAEQEIAGLTSRNTAKRNTTGREQRGKSVDRG